MPELIREFEYFVDVGGIDEVGPGPFGQRIIGNVIGGQFTGDRLKGTIVGAGADWPIVGSDGFDRVDSRVTFKTIDGALIYAQSFGLIEITPEITAILGGGNTPTNFGDQYFFINPRLETGDKRYSWVNQTLFIAEGRVLPEPRVKFRVEYRVYRVANR